MLESMHSTATSGTMYNKEHSDVTEDVINTAITSHPGEHAQECHKWKQCATRIIMMSLIMLLIQLLPQTQEGMYTVLPQVETMYNKIKLMS